ncbi:hypothetical protein JCM5353_008107 [Sporobolomyces roseus]
MLACSHLVSLFVTLGLLASCDASPIVWSPVIQTSKGLISGYQGSSGSRFTLPYAKPPVGDLRLKRPQALESWTSHPHRRLEPRCANRTFDGKNLPEVCLQNDLSSGQPIGSEDCLYMNIFTPRNSQPTSKLPVFVWVHGGSFTNGGISGIDGSALAQAQNMIVVTVQYRLGLFGWLKYSRYGFEGNYGLRDLIMALQVVQQDIAPFGGDPSQVTLAGQSSGAQMIKSLLSTPSASSLFKRAIIQSAPLDYAPQPAALADSVGKALVVDQLGGGNFLWGRYHKTDAELLAAQNQIAQQAALGQLPGIPQAEAFNVVLDGVLVTEDGQQIVSSDKQVIFTTVQSEACAAVETGIFLAQLFGIASNDFAGLVQNSYPDRAHSIIDSKLYQPATDDQTDVEDQLIHLTTDFAWVCPTQRYALAAAGKSTIYLAEFDLGIPAAASVRSELCRGKVGHEDDIAVVFNAPSSSISSAQSTLVKEVQARWGAFARTGNPNTGSYSTWPALPSTGGLQVLQLGSTSNGGSSLATSQRTEACKLYATA